MQLVVTQIDGVTTSSKNLGIIRCGRMERKAYFYLNAHDHTLFRALLRLGRFHCENWFGQC